MREKNWKEIISGSAEWKLVFWLLGVPLIVAMYTGVQYGLLAGIFWGIVAFFIMIVVGGSGIMQ